MRSVCGVSEYDVYTIVTIWKVANHKLKQGMALNPRVSYLLIQIPTQKLLLGRSNTKQTEKFL
jgi:hypothetical protein